MITTLPATAATATGRDQILQIRAQQLEAGFLSEMLRHAGSAAVSPSFGGGPGEEQFTSFLRQAQAEAIQRRGGIGLARHLFTALQERANASR